MSGQELHEGDVFYLNLTDHTGISKNTMKDPHYIAVIMNARKLQNNNHTTIICVPMTSAHRKLWDEEKNRPPHNSHHSSLLPNILN